MPLCLHSLLFPAGLLYAERNGLKTKSSHKMRKTYASMCSAMGVPIDYIREQLGHSSLSTTYGYIYNPLTEEETYKMLTRALSSNPDPEEQDTDNVVDFVSKLNKQNLSPTCRHLSPRFRANIRE